MALKLKPDEFRAEDFDECNAEVDALKKSGDYMNIFICFKCRDSLFGKRFVKMDRKPWCVLCYNEHFSTKSVAITDLYPLLQRP